METHSNLKPWQPGQSGNTNGRPVGSRSAFSAGFSRDLAEVWAEKGKASMLYTADKQTAVFFATCARLLPNDVRVTVEQALPGNLSPSDWHLMLEVVEPVKAAIPDAGSRAPGAVLEHVLDALRNCPNLPRFAYYEQSEAEPCVNSRNAASGRANSGKLNSWPTSNS
jgi:hypothetical protein